MGSWLARDDLQKKVTRTWATEIILRIPFRVFQCQIRVLTEFNKWHSPNNVNCGAFFLMFC